MVTTRTQIAGVSVRDLAARFGTPVYVYDAAKIVERVNDLKQFDVIRYAQKACSNIAILDLVRRQGVVVDAVSAGEIHRAITAGYKPGVRGQEVRSGRQHPQIVYTADIFDREALDLVVKLDIPVNCGSPDMIDQLGERAPGRNITLRINPGFGHGHSQKTNTGGEQSKHGIWHEQLDDCLRRADRHGLSVTGLHMHIGSGTDLEHLAQVCGAMEKAALTVGRTITTISAGGGLPTPYRSGQTYVDLDQYFQLWDATRKRLEEKFGHKLTLEIEPGRYLVAESGYLVTRDSGGQADGGQHVLSARRGLQQSGPADSVRGVSSDVGLPGGRGSADRGRGQLRCRTSSSAGRCANRATSSRRRKAALSASGACRSADGRRLSGHRAGRGLRLCDGLELQQQAAAARSADPERPGAPDPRPADTGRSDSRGSDSQGSP